MRIEFLGKKVSRRHGCPICGSRGRSEYKIASVYTYYLPSGKSLTARVGKPIDVSDEDGEFLLSIGDEFRGCE